MQTKTLLSVAGAALFAATASAAPSFEFGDYEGSWFNDTFMSTGAASLTIEDLGDGMIGFTLDLDGFVFGLGDPDPVSIIGAEDALGAVMFASGGADPTFGTYMGSISETGAVSAEFLDAGGGSIGLGTLMGTAIGGEIRTRYMLFGSASDSAPFATGTLNMDLVPAPASAVLMVSGLGAITRRRR